MGVVAAGVHRTRRLRGVGESRPFFDGQCVDVGAQHHGPPVAGGGAAALDAGQNARLRYGPVFDAQRGELFGDVGRGLLLLERAFGVGMQVAAESNGVHSGWKINGQKREVESGRRIAQ